MLQQDEVMDVLGENVGLTDGEDGEVSAPIRTEFVSRGGKITPETAGRLGGAPRQ